MKLVTPLAPTSTFFPRAGAIVGAVLVLFLGACSILPEPVADPTRYYVLGTSAPAEPPTGLPKGTLHIGLRAVELPLYLRNNRTLVVRSGTNEVRYQDIARWAEPLDLSIQRALRDRLLGNDAVAGAEIAPFSTDVQRDFDLNVRVQQCEGGVDAQGRKTVLFSASYEVLDQRNGGRVVVRKVFTAPAVEWDGANFGALAAHISDAVAALANDITSSLPR